MVFKSVAWLYTGSHSMFAEAVHSLADTLNQVLYNNGSFPYTEMDLDPCVRFRTTVSGNGVR